jgi:dihydroorotate dehydrogenase
MILISPPFGNWINLKGCISVKGSFTWSRRPGLIYHTVRSFRKVGGGWINQIGLRNPGIRSIKSFEVNKIYSLVGLDDGDWENMLEYCPPGLLIEVNLGCPNVHEYGMPEDVLRMYCKKFRVIAKLPPTEVVDVMAAMAIRAGAAYLHLSNTVPTPKGGLSGEPLRVNNIPIVARLAREYPHQIIAGGGIYTPVHWRAYEDAGATHFSLSTVFMTPWRVRKLLEGRTVST